MESFLHCLNLSLEGIRIFYGNPERSGLLTRFYLAPFDEDIYDGNSTIGTHQWNLGGVFEPWLLYIWYDVCMTVRKKDMNPALRRVGAIVKRHRRDLIDVKPTRTAFIEEGESSGLSYAWISEKSLANIENGYNFPSLPTLYNLAIACQMDPVDLFEEVAEAFSAHDSPYGSLMDEDI